MKESAPTFQYQPKVYGIKSARIQRRGVAAAINKESSTFWFVMVVKGHLNTGGFPVRSDTHLACIQISKTKIPI